MGKRFREHKENTSNLFLSLHFRHLRALLVEFMLFAIHPHSQNLAKKDRGGAKGRFQGRTKEL